MHVCARAARINTPWQMLLYGCYGFHVIDVYHVCSKKLSCFGKRCSVFKKLRRRRITSETPHPSLYSDNQPFNVCTLGSPAPWEEYLTMMMINWEDGSAYGFCGRRLWFDGDLFFVSKANLSCRFATTPHGGVLRFFRGCWLVGGGAFLFSHFSLFTFTILILHFVFSHPLPWGVFRWYLVIEKQRWCGRRFAATILLSPVNCWRLDGAPDRIIHQPSFWMAAAPFSSVAVVIAHSGKMSTSRPPWEIRYSLRRIAHDGGLALLFVFCVSEDDGVVALFVFGVMVRR